MKTVKFIPVLVFTFAAALFAQKSDYTKYPGYIDFGDFESLEKGEEITEVVIEEHLLKMVAKLAKNKEPELSDMISGLKLIRVNTFEVSGDTYQKLEQRAEKIDKDLMGKGWDRIVKTRSRNEFANVYIKTQGDENIVGLAVATVEKDGEAAFVNIVGTINLETIGRLGDKFDIPSLDKVTKDIN